MVASSKLMEGHSNKVKSKVTIEMDLGGSQAHVCVLNELEQVVKKRRLNNERNDLALLTRADKGATVVRKCGTHSLWVSRFLEKLGMKVFVAMSENSCHPLSKYCNLWRRGPAHHAGSPCGFVSQIPRCCADRD